jgi:sporulation protein YlmC with PRC-barrel domain
MSDNLISAVSRYLTPELIGKMASASGVDRGATQKAVDALVPGILSSLANLAGEPGGARQLANAVADQPVGILGSLAGLIGGSTQLADKGMGELGSLLGGSGLSALTSGVSRVAGIGEEPVRILTGLLTPAVLGILGREQRAAGTDASGLARMLQGQKDEIAAAMPTGLAGLLKSGDLHQTVDAARARTYEAPRAKFDGPRPVAATASKVVSDAKPGAARVSWPLWLLPLFALAGLVWYLMSSDRMTNQSSTTASAPTVARLGSAPYIGRGAPDWVSISTYYQQDVYNRAGERVGTVKDLLVGRDGRIGAALIGVGQFLGIGEKSVAVPIANLQVDGRDGNRRLMIDAAKEALQTAPAFELAPGMRRDTPKAQSSQPVQPTPRQ